jgi:hypothetical protein
MRKKSNSKRGPKTLVVVAAKAVPTSHSDLLKQDLKLLEKGLPKAIEWLASRFTQAAVTLAIALLKGGLTDSEFVFCSLMLGVCVLCATICHVSYTKKKQEYLDAISRIESTCNKRLTASPQEVLQRLAS